MHRRAPALPKVHRLKPLRRLAVSGATAANRHDRRDLDGVLAQHGDVLARGIRAYWRQLEAPGGSPSNGQVSKPL